MIKLAKGDRVELHPATDRWMRGDRYGVIIDLAPARVAVKFDRSGQTRPVSRDNILRVITA